MGSQQVDQDAADYNARVHDLTFDIGVTGAKAMAVSRFWWLGLPVVSQLFDLAMRWQAGFFYRAFARMGTFRIMDAQTAAEQIAYERAQANLQTAVATGNPSDEFEAEEVWKASVLHIVKFDGVAPID